MDTPEEILQNSRTIEVADTRCGDCNDWLSDHPRCDSCGKVRVCSGLCAGCTVKSTVACTAQLSELSIIVRRIAHGEITADEAGERLSEIAYRLSTWDVLPNPNTAAGIEGAEA